MGFLCAASSLHWSYRACSVSHSSVPAASALGQAGVPSLSSLVLLTEHNWQAESSCLAFPSLGQAKHADAFPSCASSSWQRLLCRCQTKTSQCSPVA